MQSLLSALQLFFPPITVKHCGLIQNSCYCIYVDFAQTHNKCHHPFWTATTTKKKQQNNAFTRKQCILWWDMSGWSKLKTIFYLFGHDKDSIFFCRKGYKLQNISEIDVRQKLIVNYLNAWFFKTINDTFSCAYIFSITILVYVRTVSISLIWHS